MALKEAHRTGERKPALERPFSQTTLTIHELKQVADGAVHSMLTPLQAKHILTRLAPNVQAITIV